MDFRGKTVLSVGCGLPAPTGSGVAASLVVDTRGVANQPDDHFDLIACASAGPSLLDERTLAAIAKSLRPGGDASVCELVRLSPSNSNGVNKRAADDDNGALRSLRDVEGLRRALLFAGLAPAAAAAPAPTPLTPEGAAAAVAALYPQLASAAAVGGAEAKDALAALAAVLTPRVGLCTVVCSRPTFKAGASFSLKSRAAIARPAAPAAPTAPAAPAAGMPARMQQALDKRQPPPPPATAPASADAVAAAWSAAVAAGAPNGAELINEDDLLAAEDLAAKEANMDCGTGSDGKRKACKNCSCGLREMLENEDANAAPPPEAKSACGNCALGDAYRCAGCPHRGKPAFVDGSEVKLADAMEASVAPPAVGPVGGPVGSSGGVVKLALGDTMDDDF